MLKNKRPILKNGEVLKFDGNNNEVWSFDNGFFKAYVEDLVTKRRLTKVVGSQISSRYYDTQTKKNHWDFLIPKCRLTTVIRILSGSKKWVIREGVIYSNLTQEEASDRISVNDSNSQVGNSITAPEGKEVCENQQ